jgi:hypothetical protein
VAGNDQAKLADGTYTGVQAVRFFIETPASASWNTFTTSIGLTIADTVTEGDIVAHWGSAKAATGDTTASNAAEVLAAPGVVSAVAYNPSTHAGYPGGDRAIVTDALVRLGKTVRAWTADGDGSYTPVGDPAESVNVVGGYPDGRPADQLEFLLTPTVMVPADGTGVTADLMIEDCLPTAARYLRAEWNGQALSPEVYAPAGQTAAGAELVCGADESYIRFVLPDRPANEPVAPISLFAAIDVTATAGTYTTRALISSPSDTSPAEQRDDTATFSVQSIAAVMVQNTALTPVIEQAAEGQSSEPIQRQSTMLNTLSESAGVSDPDAIVILPDNGVAGTDYTGTLEFTEATVAAGGEQVKVLYTSAADPVADPQDESNGADGSTTWCDQPASGTAVSGSGTCPSTPAEVTGLRFQRPGSFAGGDQISLVITMTATGNQPDDTYVNQVVGRAQGLTFNVGPVLAPVTVVAPPPEPTPTEEPTDPSEDPTDPSEDPTDPTEEPTEPTIDPTDPTSDPTEEPADPTSDPTDPSSEPTDPSSEPTDPSSEPTDPSSEPTDPTSEPADPTSDPTDPSSEPTDPSSEPTETSTEPTDPTESTTEPINPSTEPPTTESAVPTTDPTGPTASPTVPVTTAPNPTGSLPPTDATQATTPSATGASPASSATPTDPTEVNRPADIPSTGQPDSPIASTGGGITSPGGWLAVIAAGLAVVAVGLWVIRRRLTR